jgi:isopenicillin N synthase-like dioxygenase
MQVLTVNYLASDAPALFTKSLKETGFAVVNSHPINMSLVNDVYREWTEFFNSEDKHSYLFKKETQDGYFPLEISETAKGYTVKDIKEFYQIYPWGQYPQSLSENSRNLYHQLSTLAGTLLQWVDDNTPPVISKNFSMPLSQMISESPRTMLRVIHYPPITGDEEMNAIRAAAHEDINLITLLVAATTPGLQVKDVHGNWHEVKCDPGTIVVNVGDMLQMCTEGYYPSTTHRVINPEGEDARQARLSMPLFLHPRDEVPLSASYTAQSYLHERLRELGLI